MYILYILLYIYCANCHATSSSSPCTSALVKVQIVSSSTNIRNVLYKLNACVSRENNDTLSVFIPTSLPNAHPITPLANTSLNPSSLTSQPITS